MANKKTTGAKKTSGTKKKTTPAKNAGGNKNTNRNKAKAGKDVVIREATAKEVFSSEVMGLVLIALGILMALYLYGTMPESGIGRWIYWIMFNALGFTAFCIPPFFAVLGVITLLGSRRAPAAGRVQVIAFLVFFTAALIHLFNGTASMANFTPKAGANAAETVGNFFRAVGSYISECSGRALGTIEGSKGGGVLAGTFCLILYLIGGKVLCSVVVIAGLLICLLLATSISLKTFPDILKGSVTRLFEKIDPDDEDDEDAEEAPRTADLPAGTRKKRGMFIEVIDAEAEEKAARERKRAKAAEEDGEDDGSEYPADHLSAVNRTNMPAYNEEPSDDTFPSEEELRVTHFTPRPVRKPAPRPVAEPAPQDAKKNAEAPAGPEKKEPAEKPVNRMFIAGEEDFLEQPKEAAAPLQEEPAPGPEATAEPERAPEPFIDMTRPAPAGPKPFIDMTKPAEKKDDEPEKEVTVFRSVADMKDAFASEAYTPEQAARETAPKPAGKFTYVDEVTGEPLPEAKAAPEKYEPFSLECLKSPEQTYRKAADNPQQTAELLVETLKSFGIEATYLGCSVGPVVTRYELRPASGVRVSKITSLANDIALALAATRVRIEAPIPNKAAFGIEVPNKTSASVLLREILESGEFKGSTSAVTMAMGKDIGGKIVVADLAKMPHMLIAGSTGSGKSVCINNLILSMIYKSEPKDLRLILVDPKQVELSVYEKLPHLLIPVVTDPKKASSALRWAVNEMTLRYGKFTQRGARDLIRYNSLQEDEKEKLPRIVVIIDELADLMMVAPDEVEDSICRIAQLGRAAGIHLIVATQRPSSDVITGLIKANIPSRAAFAVSSAIDSRIILDASGAEKLLGKGDCLFHPNGADKATRLQAAFVSDDEVELIMEHYKNSTAPKYESSIAAEMDAAATGGAKGGVFGEGKQEDELLGEAVRIVLDSGQASISMIQRKLRVGYARAARLVDMMEEKGYVSGFDGSKPRKVLIKRPEFERLFGDGSYSEPEPAEEAPPEEDDPFIVPEEIP